MKKVFTLATAALLISGIAMAHNGDGKKCGTGKDKDCCKKECSKDKVGKEKKDVKKDVKPAGAAYKKG